MYVIMYLQIIKLLNIHHCILLNPVLCSKSHPFAPKVLILTGMETHDLTKSWSYLESQFFQFPFSPFFTRQ